jgi:hypothetical protein
VAAATPDPHDDGMTVTLVLPVDVDAPVVDTWRGVTDWEGQSEWMLGTRVWATEQQGRGVGGGIAAFTGIGRLGFLDTMRIEVWDPPRRCHVVHTGRLVRGTGTFDVEPLDGGRSRLVWREDLELPLGLLGRLGWPLVRPLFAFGVRLSLRRFARSVEAGRVARRAA